MMLFRAVFFMIIVPLVVISISDISNAGAFDSLRDDYVAEGSDHYQKMLEARGVLESKPASEWAAFEIETYLSESLWTIYCGAIAHKFDQDVLPFILNESTVGEYMEGWPGNPFNGWQQIRVLGTSDGFSPGDMVWQVAPEAAYSIGGRLVHTERPMSFELAVYGPDLEFASYSTVTPNKHNDWATVPEGALYMLGTHRESAAVTKAKRLARGEPN